MTDRSTERPRKEAIQAAWQSAAAGVDAQRLKLAHARLPACMRAARRRFQAITGHTAVTTIVSPVRALAEDALLPPPIHPRCVEVVSTVAEAPCEDQWQYHVRESLRSRSAHSHVCPLRLHCSCVPIHLGDSLVGVAKVVLDGGTSASDASAATATLALTVSLACQESYTSVLREELAVLQQRVDGFGNVAAEAVAPGEEKAPAAIGSLVERAVEYLHGHYREPVLPLRAAAAAAGCSEKYLTTVFKRVVGQRMRSYIAGLRVDDAGRALLDGDRPIKVIAIDCGFADSGELARAFRQRVGVSPSAYRRIFAGR